MMSRGGGLRCGAMCAMLGAAVLLAGCGAFEESPPVPTPTPTLANLLRDSSFEGEAPAWHPTGEGVAEIAVDRGRTGSQSARFVASAPASRAGFTQSITGQTDVPEFVSGYYFIDRQAGFRGDLEFSVNAIGAAGPVRELRFVIAGAASPPTFARYVFLSRDAPVLGEWVYFAYPLRQAFLDAAGAVPAGWDRLDLTFEIQAADGGAAAAYFDDLYAGPQLTNPNRPKERRE